MQPDAPSSPPWTRSVPFLTGAAVALGGGVVLTGWWLGVASLRSVVPGLESMKPVAAIALCLLGVALVLGHDVTNPPPIAAVLAATASGLIGVVTLVEYALSDTTRLDTVIFSMAVRSEGLPHPGRMAPLTAVVLVLSAGSVLLRRVGQSGPAHLWAWVVTLLSGIAVTGYLYGVSSLHGPGPDATMALHTAVSLNVLGVGLIWSTPDSGLLGLARSGRSATLLIKVAVPALILLPLGFGWLDLRAMRAGWYGPELALAIMAIAAGTSGGLVLWRATRSIAALDRARAQAMFDLSTANARLEAEVRERTASLEAQAAVQHACLEALDQGVVLSSLDAEVLLLNRAGRELLGFEPAELTELYRSGRWVSYREDGEVLPVDERPIRTTMDTGRPVSGTIVVWKIKDGTPVTMRVTTQPVFDRRGQLTGVVTAIADVTAERAAERAAELHLEQTTELNERLVRAVQTKDRFLSTATHDMRSPITTIIGFADLLTRDELAVPAAKRSEYLRAIKRQGHRLEALVQDILSVAALDGGGLSFEPRPIDVAPLLHQVVADGGWEDVVEVRGGHAVTVDADPLRLAQIVTNLLQNAVRYGRAPIVVAVEGDGTSVTIRVEDRGAGVDPAFVPELFERFTTDRGRTDPESRGTGLGLAIVRGLARLHGGDVTYEPNVPTGACFVVRLPSRTASVAGEALGVAVSA